MKLFINAIASYPEGTVLTDEDQQAIREDIEDCLRFTGKPGAGYGITIEMEQGK